MVSSRRRTRLVVVLVALLLTACSETAARAGSVEVRASTTAPLYSDEDRLNAARLLDAVRACDRTANCAPAVDRLLLWGATMANAHPGTAMATEAATFGSVVQDWKSSGCGTPAAAANDGCVPGGDAVRMHAERLVRAVVEG